MRPYHTGIRLIWARSRHLVPICISRNVARRISGTPRRTVVPPLVCHPGGIARGCRRVQATQFIIISLACYFKPGKGWSRFRLVAKRCLCFCARRKRRLAQHCRCVGIVPTIEILPIHLCIFGDSSLACFATDQRTPHGACHYTTRDNYNGCSQYDPSTPGQMWNE